MDEEVERLRTFRNNFPSRRIESQSLLSPLDCPAFPKDTSLNSLTSHHRAGFEIFHMSLGTPQLSRNE